MQKELTKLEQQILTIDQKVNGIYQFMEKLVADQLPEPEKKGNIKDRMLEMSTSKVQVEPSEPQALKEVNDPYDFIENSTLVGRVNLSKGKKSYTLRVFLYQDDLWVALSDLRDYSYILKTGPIYSVLNELGEFFLKKVAFPSYFKKVTKPNIVKVDSLIKIDSLSLTELRKILERSNHHGSLCTPIKTVMFEIASELNKFKKDYYASQN